jgi:hypothetical protein
MVSHITEAIQRGDLDEDLDGLAAAIRDRQRVLSRLRAAQACSALQAGDRVQFTDDARPGYLPGVGGVIAGVNKTSTRVLVDVDEDPRAGRFSGARSVPCPPSILRAAPDLPFPQPSPERQRIEESMREMGLDPTRPILSQIAHLFRVVPGQTPQASPEGTERGEP